MELTSVKCNGWILDVVKPGTGFGTIYKRARVRAKVRLAIESKLNGANGVKTWKCIDITDIFNGLVMESKP